MLPKVAAEGDMLGCPEALSGDGDGVLDLAEPQSAKGMAVATSQVVGRV